MGRAEASLSRLSIETLVSDLSMWPMKVRWKPASSATASYESFSAMRRAFTFAATCRRSSFSRPSAMRRVIGGRRV